MLPSSPSFSAISSLAPRQPLAKTASTHDEDRTSEKAASVASQALVLPPVNTSSPPRKRLAIHTSSSSSSSKRDTPLPHLSSGMGSSFAGIEPPPLLLDDSLPYTQDEQTVLPIIEPKEGKTEAVLKPPVSRPSSPSLRGSKVKKEELSPEYFRINLLKKEMLKKKVVSYIENSDLTGALECVEEISKIAKSLKINSLFADRMAIEIRMIQSIQDAHIRELIQNFLNKYSSKRYPSEIPFIIKILKYRIEINYNENDKEANFLQLESDLKQLLKLTPSEQIKDAFILKYLAALYYLQAKFEQAFIYLQEAVSLIPDDPFVITHLGLLWIKKATFEEGDRRAKYRRAISYFQKALENNERNVLALKGCALAHFRLGMPRTALKHASSAKKISPLDKEISGIIRMILVNIR